MIFFGVFLLALVAFPLCLWQARQRGLGRWLVAYLLQAPRRWRTRSGSDIHVILCIADHFEPHGSNVPPEAAQARVNHWLSEYPAQFSNVRDSDGRPPRHTFFYPLEDYDATHLDNLTELCRQGFGEVEVHLHHDHDTAEQLRLKLLTYKRLLAERHGQLAVDRDTGEVMYGFIHGNWALDNARPDGRWCGVNNELDVLRQTGCYADFTLPCAPAPGQTRKINSIYYAIDDPARPLSHDTGMDVGTGTPPDDGLLLIQGPLLLDWGRRKWGLLPRIENGCLQAGQPPSAERLALWLRAGVQVPTRPDWFFVKLHTHGAPEANQQVLLGEAMSRFHQALAERAVQDRHFHFHYVSAREMYNLAKAAEAGWQGSVAQARDWQLLWYGSGRSFPAKPVAPLRPHSGHQRATGSPAVREIG